MQKNQMVVGKAFVNEDAGIIREVIEEIDENCVQYNSFDLSTGSLTPTRHRICHKGQLARWAHREASGPELALIHPYRPSDEWAGIAANRVGGITLEAARTERDTSPGQHMFPPGK